MAMKTRADYVASLDDGRKMYADGQLVSDLTAHVTFRTTIERVGDGYERYYRPGDDACGPYFEIPRSREELKHLMHELLEWDMVTVTTSQGLMAYLTAAARIRPALPEYADRIERYFAYCRDNDIRCVQAITDAKGDRRVGPSKQEDPDVYTRIVERRPDGIVIRGAKLHISSAAVCHEMLVMPTKMMKPGEEDWAVACAVPVNAPGVTHHQHQLRAAVQRERLPAEQPVQHPRGLRRLRRRVRAQ